MKKYINRLLVIVGLFCISAVTQVWITQLRAPDANAVLVGGPSANSTVEQVSGLGTTGQALVSNGTGAKPTWQTVSGGGGSITNRTYRYVSPLIDFKTVAATTIFTTDPSLGRFVIEDIYVTSTVFTGYSSGGTFNFGWTASAYSDYASASITNQVTNLAWKLSGNAGNVNRTSVPANTAFRLSISTGINATTATGYVIVAGFYLSN